MTPEHVYTHGHHESVLRSHRWRTAENSAGYLLPALAELAARRPDLHLLDVGSGPGTITADLARAVAPGRVTALEVGEGALDLTRRELASQGVTGVELVVGDVHALDLPDDSVDVVHAHQVLQHVADPVQALREMRRVTRPGGLVAVRDSDYSAFTWWPRVPELDAWLDLYRDAARANGGEPDAGRRLLSWARAAGFTDLRPSSATWCFATPDDRAWWGGLWADRITTSALADQLVSEGRATRDDLERVAAGWRTWAADPDGWLSLLHGEVLAVV
ncbi:methyltransferase domain-containing protein [Nocardioides sp. AX2bis]|uniref:methyltransferase domain-containing protein n=1 Tax=Nocardioides sp. AX2bis TaxID=2653157 RepID=UPI0012F13EB5|nr:methyltransferase domain-containing protein [Nocardioides sp. AX2bis]VXB56520.1 Ubiquinone/menaquinone biosynthesis C-methylase UbiE [Nocardioides sp. AX2bis]